MPCQPPTRVAFRTHAAIRPLYRELRSRRLLTAPGEVELSRPYYLCPHCHQGQFPADVELDIEHTEFSPGVRRMQALVGQDAPFDHGREQIKVLAGLEVTTKSVERTAKANGADIARREREQIDKAIQLDLPAVLGKPIPVLYVEMDGTGVPVVKKETVGRQGKTDGQPAHTPGGQAGMCVHPSRLRLGCSQTGVRYGCRMIRVLLNREG